MMSPGFPDSAGRFTPGGLQQYRSQQCARAAHPMTGHVAPHAALRLACRLLIAVAWLLRQPEDAVTVQELVDLYSSACRTPAGR